MKLLNLYFTALSRLLSVGAAVFCLLKGALEDSTTSINTTLEGGAVGPLEIKS